MNYSKKSTSRKQKALKSRKSKMGKKLGVVFLKTLIGTVHCRGRSRSVRQGSVS